MEARWWFGATTSDLLAGRVSFNDKLPPLMTGAPPSRLAPNETGTKRNVTTTFPIDTSRLRLSNRQT